jgi:hypothetical protein
MEAPKSKPPDAVLARSTPDMPGTGVDAPKPKKVIKVPLYGHVWSVHPLACRGKVIFRVFHRVDGKRVSKTFMTRQEATAEAKSLLKARYGKGESQIHLTEDEKRDWQAARAIQQQAGIRSSFESISRHYTDLCAAAGGAGLLTDIVRKHAAINTPTRRAQAAGH